MKLLWNSLLISIGLLLPTTTTAVLAESASVPTAEILPGAEATPIAQDPSPTPESVVVPSVTQTRPSEAEPTEPLVVPEVSPTAEEAEATATPDSSETETPEATAETTDDEEAEATEPELSPEEQARQQKLIEADRLYLNGQIAAAQQLYREAKEPFDAEVEAQQKPEPIYEPAQLSPAGSVYWRQSEEGLAQALETKILVPLEFLVEQEPAFIPGHLRYAEALQTYEREEEALRILERAIALYPNEPELLEATMTALGESEQWLEASMMARQFALLNTEHPQAEEFDTLADEYLERHQSHLRSELRGNAIANAITGALGYVLTGNLFGPISAIETTALMLRGESAVGESIANRAQEQLPMVEDEAVLAYVREIGNKLTVVSGRDEFDYEFHVILDENLNAFALPGGKVFVNAGAILKTQSEAELAGLIAHEIAHAVLSHGFQLATQGNLVANVTQYFPFGGTAANLIVLDYSRDMERQADALGTRILTSGGYAADGLHNLMVTLDEQERERPIFVWLSTHPDTQERIRNLETLIERNGYNRYAYEGIERHQAIQERVAQLLEEYEKRQECEESGECEETEDTNDE